MSLIVHSCMGYLPYSGQVLFRYYYKDTTTTASSSSLNLQQLAALAATIQQEFAAASEPNGCTVNIGQYQILITSGSKTRIALICTTSHSTTGLSLDYLAFIAHLIRDVFEYRCLIAIAEAIAQEENSVRELVNQDDVHQQLAATQSSNATASAPRFPTCQSFADCYLQPLMDALVDGIISALRNFGSGIPHLRQFALVDPEAKQCILKIPRPLPSDNEQDPHFIAPSSMVIDDIGAPAIMSLLLQHLPARTKLMKRDVETASPVGGGADTSVLSAMTASISFAQIRHTNARGGDMTPTSVHMNAAADDATIVLHFPCFCGNASGSSTTATNGSASDISGSCALPSYSLFLRVLDLGGVSMMLHNELSTPVAHPLGVNSATDPTLTTTVPIARQLILLALYQNDHLCHTCAKSVRNSTTSTVDPWLQTGHTVEGLAEGLAALEQHLRDLCNAALLCEPVQELISEQKDAILLRSEKIPQEEKYVAVALPMLAIDSPRLVEPEITPNVPVTPITLTPKPPSAVLYPSPPLAASDKPDTKSSVSRFRKDRIRLVAPSPLP